MATLSLRATTVQTQRQDQRLAFGQFVRIEQSEWLEPQYEMLASKLQEEINRNEFLERTENTHASPSSKAQWKRREGYGASAGTPRLDLTERHYAWLQNQTASLTPEAFLCERLYEQLLDARIDHDDLNYPFAEFVIAHLDRFGWLTESLETLVCSFHEIGGSCSEEEAWKTLHSIQEFDPPGVAAQNDAERLDLIIRRVSSEASIADDFDPPLRHLATLRRMPRYLSLLKGNLLEELAVRLGAEDDVLPEALDELRRILRRFDPFNGYSQSAELVTPDIVFSVTGEGEISYSVTAPHGPRVCVPRVYESVAVPRSNGEAFNKARQLVSAIGGRYQMLDSIAQALIDLQGGFIRHGKERLRPLLQKTLAKWIDKDDSTVSRTLHGKRIETPHGTYPIKICFPKEVVAGSGATEEQLKVVFAAVLAREPKDSPWSDDRIAGEIADAFRFRLARKTVQKYRAKFAIGTAKERKQAFTKRSA